MKDIKSIIIGFLLAVCIFLFVGFTGYNQGDIACNSISLIDKNGDIYMKIDKSFIDNYEMSNEIIKNMNQLLTLPMEEISKIKENLNNIEDDLINLNNNNNNKHEQINSDLKTIIEIAERLDNSIINNKNNIALIEDQNKAYDSKVDSINNALSKVDLSINKISGDMKNKFAEVQDQLEELEDDISSVKTKTQRDKRYLDAKISELESILLIDDNKTSNQKKENTAFRYVAREVEPRPMFGYEVEKFITYPKEAQNAGIEGRVIVAAFINTSGETENVYIVKGVYEILDQVALKAVKQSKWIPALQKGERIGVWVNIPVSFKLK